MGGGGCLKRGTETSLQTMPTVFTLYFKFLRCLTIYQIAAATFPSQILIYSLKHPPPDPLNESAKHDKKCLLLHLPKL